MSQPYVGEIRIFAGNFAPAGWMLCNGAVLPISENEVLFQLIGTTYGGDGEETFALPNLQSRVPVHMGTSAGRTFQIGETGGVETVTLTVQQLPAHAHTPTAGGTADSTNPSAATWGMATQARPYAAATPDANMSALAIQGTGGSQPHDNMAPFLGVNFIISLFGVFPTPS